MDAGTEQLAQEKFERFPARMMKVFITVLGRTISPEQLSAIQSLISQQGFATQSVEHLLPPACLAKLPANAYACARIKGGGDSDTEPLRRALLEFAEVHHLDIALESESTYGSQRRLIAVDMDSTLIPVEVIDELAKLAGVGEQVSRITESAMRGEIDFKQSFTRRLSLLRGLPVAKLDSLMSSIPLSEGAELLIAGAKELGMKAAILSGGFTFVGQHLQSLLKVDHMFANQLEIADGLITGRVKGEIVDGERKKQLLQAIAKEEGIPLSQVVAVGDGANDLPMLGISGLGIAFHAKPLVRQTARFAISQLGLDAVLYLITPGLPLD